MPDAFSVLNSAFEHLHIGDEAIFSEQAGEKGPHAGQHPAGGQASPDGNAGRMSIKGDHHDHSWDRK